MSSNFNKNIPFLLGMRLPGGDLDFDFIGRNGNVKLNNKIMKRNGAIRRKDSQNSAEIMGIELKNGKLIVRCVDIFGPYEDGFASPYSLIFESTEELLGCLFFKNLGKPEKTAYTIHDFRR